MPPEARLFKMPAAAGVPLLAAGTALPAEPVVPAHAYELAHPHEASVWRATGSEEPVFLDPAGRRRPLVRVAGAGAAMASAVWLTALVTGAIGFSNLPGGSGALPAAVPGAPGGPSLAASVTPRIVPATARGRGRMALDVDHPRRRRDVDHALKIVRV